MATITMAKPEEFETTFLKVEQLFIVKMKVVKEGILC